MQQGSGRSVARLALTVVSVLVLAFAGGAAAPAEALSPNNSVLLIQGRKAQTGVLSGTTYTRKRTLALHGATAAAATRTSLALYDKDTGRLRTGTFRKGIFKPVETITLRSGFSHAIGSCDTLLLYNKSTGRTMTGTLIGGRFRNRAALFLPRGITELASSCDTAWLRSPVEFPEGGGSAIQGTLSGGDFTQTHRYLLEKAYVIGMNSTSYVLHLSGILLEWGIASDGEATFVGNGSTLDAWATVGGAASTLIYSQDSGYACIEQMANGVRGASECASGRFPPGRLRIVGGR